MMLFESCNYIPYDGTVDHRACAWACGKYCRNHMVIRPFQLLPGATADIQYSYSFQKGFFFEEGWSSKVYAYNLLEFGAI